MIKKYLKYWWLLALILLIWGITWRILNLNSLGYKWIESGFQGKTWWDILELLIIPITLAGVAIVIEFYERKADREINLDNQRERLLQNYFDFISKLILEYNLKDTEPDDEIRKIARTKTKTSLKRLDATRKATLIEFLIETKLIHSTAKDNPPIISLERFDLSYINMTHANLNGAKLQYANLEGADLRAADLSHANLSGANLIGTNLNVACLIGTYLGDSKLMHASLWGAKLNNANLMCANLSDACLKGASLNGAELRAVTMPDGIRFDPKIHTIEYLTGRKPDQK